MRKGKDRVNSDEVALCGFLGIFGAHKFYRKQYLLGIVYLFTFGLFFAGWFLDFIKLLEEYITNKQLSNENSNRKDTNIEKFFKRYNVKNVGIAVLSILLFFTFFAWRGSNGVKNENKIKELEETVADLKDEKKTFEEKDYSGEVLENENKELRGKIEALEKEKVDLGNEIKSLENEKKDLTSRISELEGSTASNEVDLSQISDSVPVEVDDGDSEIVYITNTGSKYHRSGCSYLKSSNPIEKSDAIARGYTACSRCKP